MEYETPPCAAYWRTDAVFIGTLLKIERESEDPLALRSANTFHFQVEKSFKGVTGKRVETDISIGSCYDDDQWKVGAKYLMYAHDVGGTQSSAASLRGTNPV